MKNFAKLILVVIALGGITRATVLAFRRVNVDEAINASWNDYLMRIERNQTLRNDVATRGLEPDSAGFHLVPTLREDYSPFDEIADPEIGGLGTNWGHIGMCSIESRSLPQILATINGVETLVPSRIQVALERRFPNTYLANPRRVDAGTGIGNVEVAFTAAGISLLSAQVNGGVNSTNGRIIDWSGAYVGPGAPTTVMRAILVAKNVAYECINVQDVILQPAGTHFIVARDLPVSTADEIVTLFGR